MIVDAKLIEKLWDRFNSIQSFIRNTAHPIYKKHYLNKDKSGTFLDIATLKSIWQITRTDAIMSNVRNHKSSYFKSARPGHGAYWSPEIELQSNLGPTLWSRL